MVFALTALMHESASTSLPYFSRFGEGVIEWVDISTPHFCELFQNNIIRTVVVKYQDQSWAGFGNSYRQPRIHRSEKRQFRSMRLQDLGVPGGWNSFSAGRLG